MGSLALLAREAGFRVSGSDQHVYPPMSTQLEQQGIELNAGYDPKQLNPAPDLVVIGNAMTRGNPAVEYVLDKGLPYTSGPEFFARHILKDKWVLGVSGTHGKTTTSSMLAWILEYAGMAPGFLIGGIPEDFGISARTGDTPFFVVEADEYDTAFFDKRSKFVHYRPRTLIINNLEFDHGDIFENLGAIQKQFHHLVRTIPAGGRVIYPGNSPAIDEVIAMGCWSELGILGEKGTLLTLEECSNDGSAFRVCYDGRHCGEVRWSHQGRHNVANAFAAIAAAHHVGILPETACEALSRFKGVKRRMELVAEVEGIKIYDDFAHHPTAIKTTLEGLRAQLGDETVIRVIIEPRSNTMRMGIHKEALIDATSGASEAIWFESDDMQWSLDALVQNSPVSTRVMQTTDAIVSYLSETANTGDHILIMSNGGFDGIHSRIATALKKRNN